MRNIIARLSIASSSTASTTADRVVSTRSALYHRDSRMPAFDPPRESLARADEQEHLERYENSKTGRKIAEMGGPMPRLPGEEEIIVSSGGPAGNKGSLTTMNFAQDGGHKKRTIIGLVLLVVIGAAAGGVFVAIGQGDGDGDDETGNNNENNDNEYNYEAGDDVDNGNDEVPGISPTLAFIDDPTLSPSFMPTGNPTETPTASPTATPTESPTFSLGGLENLCEGGGGTNFVACLQDGLEVLYLCSASVLRNVSCDGQECACTQGLPFLIAGGTNVIEAACGEGALCLEPVTWL